MLNRQIFELLHWHCLASTSAVNFFSSFSSTSGCYIFGVYYFFYRSVYIYYHIKIYLVTAI